MWRWSRSRRPIPACPGLADERGMVTAEMAVALPALALVLAAAVWVVAVVGAQLRCVDAAREAARALARGEPAQVAERLAHQVAPADATVWSVREGDLVTVTVTTRSRGPGPVLSRLQPVTVSGEATTTWEDTDAVAGW